MKNRSILLTLGNPNGVGPEITLKALKRLTVKEKSEITVIGCPEAFNSKEAGLDGVCFEPVQADQLAHGYLYQPGEKTLASGYLSYLFIEKAIELAKAGKAGAIVTAPVSKELIVNAGITGFLDHTTHFTKAFGSTRTSMFFYSKDLKVLLATIHLPLKDVPSALTEDCLNTALDNAVAFCKSYYQKHFKIGVCGLNPHAGENGLIGKEDRDVITPVIHNYPAGPYSIEGPYPSDTLFYKAYHGDYDLVVAMYHDQGLAPFKLLHFHDGVNTTLGLPVIRTSPDHGTAFDIAGKGIADESSMLEAIRLAQKLLIQNEAE